MTAAKDLFTKVLDYAAKSTKSKTGFMGLLSDNTITLKNLLFSAVVVGLELLLSSQLFDCPLKNHKRYGLMFLIAPFFIVFMMNLLLIGEVWKITDRCLVGDYRRCCEFGFWMCPNVVKAFVGPCVWLIASFADSKYYVCAAVGQDVEKRNLTNAEEIKELEAKFADAKSLSHLWAWIIFLVMVFVTAIVMSTKKCCLKDTFLLEDNYILERREAIAALLTFRGFTNPQHRDVEKGEENNRDSEGGSAADEAKAEEKEKKPEEKENAEEKTGRFLGNEENITLYPDGIPEQRGIKWVEKLFKSLAKDDDGSWDYDKAYDKFEKQYPRVASGRPWDPWVKNKEKKKSDDNEVDGNRQEKSKKRSQYSEIPTEGQIEAESAC